ALRHERSRFGHPVLRLLVGWALPTMLKRWWAVPTLQEPSGSRRQRNVSEPSGVINRLLEELTKLPGIGPKSAERIAHFLLSGDRKDAVLLADALRAVAEHVRPCTECFNLTDRDLCPVCADPRRDPATICVVETPRDLSI